MTLFVVMLALYLSLLSFNIVQTNADNPVTRKLYKYGDDALVLQLSNCNTKVDLNKYTNFPKFWASQEYTVTYDIEDFKCNVDYWCDWDAKWSGEVTFECKENNI